MLQSRGELIGLSKIMLISQTASIIDAKEGTEHIGYVSKVDDDGVAIDLAPSVHGRIHKAQVRNVHI